MRGDRAAQTRGPTNPLSTKVHPTSSNCAAKAIWRPDRQQDAARRKRDGSEIVRAPLPGPQISGNPAIIL